MLQFSLSTHRSVCSGAFHRGLQYEKVGAICIRVDVGRKVASVASRIWRARGRAIENGFDASTTTDLAAIRGVDASPYIVEECASRRVIALRVIDSREGLMVVKRCLGSLQRQQKANCY